MENHKVSINILDSESKSVAVATLSPELIEDLSKNHNISALDMAYNELKMNSTIDLTNGNKVINDIEYSDLKAGLIKVILSDYLQDILFDQTPLEEIKSNLKIKLDLLSFGTKIQLDHRNGQIHGSINYNNDKDEWSVVNFDMLSSKESL